MDIGFNFAIGEKPVVIDVGGYQGEFTDYIRKKYGCGVHIFEPVHAQFQWLVTKYRDDPLVWPYDVALEDRDCEGSIYLRENSTSLYLDGPSERIRIRDIWRFILGFQFPKIDILKLNCEGSEFKIMNRLFEFDWMRNVRNVVVQFHAISPTAAEDIAAIRTRMQATHCVRHQDDHWTWYEKL